MTEVRRESIFALVNPDEEVPPSERVKDILGVNEDVEIPKALFCQMNVLHPVEGSDDVEWKEAARWIKYEEDVEEGGEKWSKPHVATLSLHALFETRRGIMNGTVLLECDADNLISAFDQMLEDMVRNNMLSDDTKDLVLAMLLKPHRRQYQRKASAMVRRNHSHGDLLESKKKPSFAAIDPEGVLHPTLDGSDKGSSGTLKESASSAKLNQKFMKKVPDGSETANILVGEVEDLTEPILGLIRLQKSLLLENITEVPVPSRFIIVIMGPPVANIGPKKQYQEIGRCLATLLADEVFHEVAYKAKDSDDLLAGVDEFLDSVTVLPPSVWDPTTRIEPPQKTPSAAMRKHSVMPNGPVDQEEEEEEEVVHGDPNLVRTGRLFGGLIADIKRRAPHYLSDFRDALHYQSIASFIFLYFACITPIVTFGGLLGDATKNYMGTMESILSGAISGVVYHLFSGQPMNIVGATGPMLVFEMIVYQVCDDNNLHFLSFRFWIGIWIALILLLVVAFDLSALVRYITRFTEESFAALISIIFIYEAFHKLVKILKSDPVDLHPEIKHDYTCFCLPPNSTANGTNFSYVPNEISTGHARYRREDVGYTVLPVVNALGNATNTSLIDWSYVTKGNCTDLGGELVGIGCGVKKYVPDVFFLSCLLFIGTYIIAMGLKQMKTTRYFPSFIRQMCSDFAVIIAIAIMAGIDAALGLHTPKLLVPEEFKPTRDDRGWLVNPGDVTYWWLSLLGVVPALLATILIFMDQQITAVIVNRKENKLKKGHGYHLDMLVIVVLIVVCSLLGLPWYVASTVVAINHVQSLRIESECTAPGEKPEYMGVREQRVTGICIHLAIGLSIFLTAVLRFIPMAVLYGVFLYMGVASLSGVQFVQRIAIMFMPQKYQPDYMYLRHVPTKRVHIFTVIQIICMVGMWVIKSVKIISIAFPLMVLALCFVRKGMDFFFSQEELKWLDDIMPETHKREKEDAKKKKEEELGEQIMELSGNIRIPLRGGKFVDIPAEKVVFDPRTGTLNLPKEVSKADIWKSLMHNDSDVNLKRLGIRKPDGKDSNGVNSDTNGKGKDVSFQLGEGDETERLLPGSPGTPDSPPPSFTVPQIRIENEGSPNLNRNGNHDESKL